MPPTDLRHDDPRTDDARLRDRLPAPQARSLDPRHDGRRSRLRLPPHTYALSGRDVDTLRTVGSFRAVRAIDLHDTRQIAPDAVRTLHAQRLLDSRRIDGDVYLTLTREGQRVLRALDPQLVTYRGFVKARELRHDGALYRMCHAHARALHCTGATIERIRLDDELKALVHRAAHKQAQAQALGLPYDPATHRVQFPDLQLEYRTPSGERARVNLELTTVHYRVGAVRTKAAAGFVLYRLGAGGGPGTARHQSTGAGGHRRPRELDLYAL